MSVKRRKYKNYNEYLKHQSIKLDIGIRKNVKKFRPESFDKNVRYFVERLTGFEKYIKGDNILCLGARLGMEVVAFRQLGFQNAIGIDLNPGENNQYVIKGDFNDMPFDDNCFNTVYTNSLDHAWNIRRLSKEINRVLCKEGRLILEIDHLLNKSKKDRLNLLNKTAKYESVMWENFDDIKSVLKEFKLISKFVGVYDIFLVVVFGSKK